MKPHLRFKHGRWQCQRGDSWIFVGATRELAYQAWKRWS